MSNSPTSDAVPPPSPTASHSGSFSEPPATKSSVSPFRVPGAVSFRGTTDGGADDDGVSTQAVAKLGSGVSSRYCRISWRMTKSGGPAVGSISVCKKWNVCSRSGTDCGGTTLRMLLRASATLAIDTPNYNLQKDSEQHKNETKRVVLLFINALFFQPPASCTPRSTAVAPLFSPSAAGA